MSSPLSWNCEFGCQTGITSSWHYLSVACSINDYSNPGNFSVIRSCFCSCTANTFPSIVSDCALLSLKCFQRQYMPLLLKLSSLPFVSQWSRTFIVSRRISSFHDIFRFLLLSNEEYRLPLDSIYASPGTASNFSLYIGHHHLASVPAAFHRFNIHCSTS